MSETHFYTNALLSKFLSDYPFLINKENSDTLGELFSQLTPIAKNWLMAFDNFLNDCLNDYPKKFPLITDDFDNHGVFDDSVDYHSSSNSYLSSKNNHYPIGDIVVARSLGMDYLLTHLSAHLFDNQHNVAIFAIGGYGRLELSPKSDLDLLILYHQIDENCLTSLNAFLWDIGLKPASIYYPLDHHHHPKDLSLINDISHTTALLDARLIFGNDDWQNLPKQWLCQHWDYPKFYNAKIDEKNTRQAQHQYTVQHLEPNLKTGVGGLRAVQLVIWLLQAYDLFHLQSLGHSYQSDCQADCQFNHQMPTSFIALSHSFFNEKEQTTLKNALQFFWLIRHYLHRHCKKNDDKLLFDHQKTISEFFDFQKNNNPNNAPEQLMHQYFKNAMAVHCVVECLYELLSPDFIDDWQQHSLEKKLLSNATMIDDNFMIITCLHTHKKQINIKDHRLFLTNPTLLLTIFATMANLHIKKIHSHTLRHLAQYASLIDDDYRNNPIHQAIFLRILSNKNQLANLLNLMAKYGVLARYLPAFGAITGLMQYDMFHRYTVDNHTLRLLAIFGQFGGFDGWLPSDLLDEKVKQNRHFSDLCTIYHRLDKPHLLHIAGLFHDIAKGMTGDHAVNGAIIADEFCRQHGFDDDDGELISWLVREHLTMSHIAQKKDIHEPSVVLEFAKLVKDQKRLDYLYLLTVADMNATNNQLWNDWRATLLNQLYQGVGAVLEKNTPVAISDILHRRKQEAITMLTVRTQAVMAFWQGFDDDYFGKDNADTLAWHANTILANGAGDLENSLKNSWKSPPIIASRPHPDTGLNAYELMVFCQAQTGLFLKIVQVLDALHYDILKASITTNRHQYALDNFVILSRIAPNGDDKAMMDTLCKTLYACLFLGEALPTPSTINHSLMPLYHHTPKSSHFLVTPKVQLTDNLDTTHTLFVVTKDRPHLLWEMVSTFANFGIVVHNASVMTMGVRAEDSFVIGGETDKLSKEVLDELQKALLLVVSCPQIAYNRLA